VAKHHIWFVPGPLSEHSDGPWTLQDTRKRGALRRARIALSC